MLPQMFDLLKHLPQMLRFCKCYSYDVVLLCYYLLRFKLTRVAATLSDMSDSCLLLSFRSNSTFIMLYLYHEMNVEYLVVDEMLDIKVD
jgi:hypothetical protein